MLEFYEPGAAIIEDSIAKAVTRSTKANKSALEFVSGAQAAMVEEIVFTTNEIFDRIRTKHTCLTNFSPKWLVPIRSTASRRCTKSAASIRSTSFAAIVNGCSSTATG